MTPGIWLGQGQILIHDLGQTLRYYTRWIVKEAENGVIYCDQEVEVQDFPEKSHNYYAIAEISHHSFVIQLESSTLGQVQGKGIIRDTVIAWEFNQQGQACTGFEIFEKTEDDRYITRAEFGHDAAGNTLITGVLWR
jgi:hypothetical protein